MGLLGIFLALKYRQPISGAHSIAGAVLVAGALTHFSLNEAIGAYLIAHILVILLGFSGLIDKVMKWIPVPIVMGMIVGVMIRFTTEMITSVTISPLLAGFAILVFLISSTILKESSTCINDISRCGRPGSRYKSIPISKSQDSFVFPQIIMPTLVWMPLFRLEFL